MHRKAYIPKNLSEEIKLFTFARSSFYFKDLLTVAVFAGMFFLCSSSVNSWFIVPYVIFACVISVYLVLPATATNPGKRNWEAIALMLAKDRRTVFSLNPQRTTGYDILKTLPAEKEKSNESR
ncbi:MAG: DUF5592 family protein [Oscillospiraceae bacterium]|jgi:hypothetical protein|nr:DUF5592 family protein [Oscillospiraceae bacterium]